MIKTVIFDLGGVYFSDGTKKAIEMLSKFYKISHQRVTDILQGDLGTRYREGNITADAFWGQAKDYWKVSVPSQDLAAIWLKSYKQIKGTTKIIDRLNAAGYELLFLSDNVQERVDYLEKKYLFLEKFKDGIFSHLVHVRKPDPLFYKMALEKASHAAEECAYIDDKPEFLKPAQEFGMVGIAFENPMQLEQALKGEGLEF
tara:strand:+ start:115 stop:717 length:603 start_codon:yes stop_codon:yes gene_type:complete